MSREQLLTAATRGLTAPDAPQVAAHLADLYWPEAEWFNSGHAHYLAGEMQAMYSRWTGRTGNKAVRG